MTRISHHLTTRRSVLLGGLGAASAAFLTACGADAGTPEAGTDGGSSAADGLQEVSIGIVPVVEMASVYIAIDHGFFEEAGLKVTPQVMQSAPAMIPSVVNGQLTFGTAAVPAFVSAAQQGLPLVATTGAGLYALDAEGDTAALFASPKASDSITRPRDLEGKTVTTNAINSGPHVGLVATIKKDGGDPSLVNFAVMPMADSLAAMAAGTVDAGLLVEPFRTSGEEEGLIRKFSAYVETGLEAFIPGSSCVVLFTNAQQIQGNPDVVKRLNQAMEKGNDLANKDPQAIVDSMAKHSDMTPEVLEKIVKTGYATRLDIDGIQHIADLMAENGAIPGTVDVTSYINEVA